MTAAAVNLDDKYALQQGTIYITGSQALVRLPMMQLARDRANGLNTGCFISGYRGSPMHNFDKELWRAKRFLDGGHIHFQPAVNEDLAATSLWGSQQTGLMAESRYDGVFGIWYGKGPGLDRSMDAIRHANLAGTSPHGGVLAVVGDDHGMASSDVPATSEPTFTDLLMPMLYPGNVQELLDLGLLGIALSRFCGAWVGVKAISDTLDAVATVNVDTDAPRIIIPDFEFPPDGVHLREPDPWLEQEPRLRHFKMAAALAFASANGLNRVVIKSRQPRFGIIANGKSTYDVKDALLDLGIDAQRADALGITVMQISMPHPLDPQTLRDFALGLDEVLVVEEKRRIIETNLKDALYSAPDGQRPRVVGRFDESGERLLPEVGEIAPAQVVRAIASRIEYFHRDDRVREHLAFLDAKAAETHSLAAIGVKRTPYFCSGCPHNSSTRLPEGSIAFGGVGCHFMATYMDRDNMTHTHMGGEGANWIGLAPFVDRGHVFQNLGDGTFFHSGLLAIRACHAAGVNITYKILFNDAVAMTGGQPIDGPQSPATIAAQVRAEGVQHIVVVSDDPERSRAHQGYPGNVSFEHRDVLNQVQDSLRDTGGVSVLIYDQTCAAEKRRRRKRGDMEDPTRRVFINERVCEGCGDCSTQSNCLSVVPVETPNGRKRRIDQSSCNKDYSCLKGFCPSFVSVVGGTPKRNAAQQEIPNAVRLLPEPARPAIEAGRTYNVLVTGIGGTGVVTVGAMLTMAAHLEGRACSSVDQFGMAQKGGAVTSHIRLAAKAEDIQTARMTVGGADLLLGCDSLVAASELALAAIDRKRTRVVVNTHQAITGQFTRDPNLLFPKTSIEQRLQATSGAHLIDFVDATKLANSLLGDAILSNMFMLGFAYQKGAVPLSASSIEQAIGMNGVAVEANISAFSWGRRAAIDLAAVASVIEPRQDADSSVPTLDALIERHIDDLTTYADAAYAERYRKMVQSMRAAEAALGVDGPSEVAATLTETVARTAYRLMAIKDEYEVARLFTDGAFAKAVEDAFEGTTAIEFHMAPPLFARTDPRTGHPMKRRFGPWMMGALKLLARAKRIRGTLLDPFRFNRERTMEKALIERFEAVVAQLAKGLSTGNLATAHQTVEAFDSIRGYGHVKLANHGRAIALIDERLANWRDTGKVVQISGTSTDRKAVG
ncbi:MAG: indolepyruvate ferredoxin oxidoreductase family protein [Chromatiales bacterium]|jgi:indolepyruvate ferredoxin oxidoreductase|nr:indolepyruvate ferredoxin oxidoreductase family protein [Chromatiales bacterium]